MIKKNNFSAPVIINDEHTL